MTGRSRDTRETRGRGGRSSRGADETIVFDPPPRRGSGGGGGRRGRDDEGGGRRGRGDEGGGRVRLMDLCSDWLSMIVAIRQVADPTLDAESIRNRTLELKS